MLCGSVALPLVFLMWLLKPCLITHVLLFFFFILKISLYLSQKIFRNILLSIFIYHYSRVGFSAYLIFYVARNKSLKLVLMFILNSLQNGSALIIICGQLPECLGGQLEELYSCWLFPSFSTWRVFYLQLPSWSEFINEYWWVIIAELGLSKGAGQWRGRWMCIILQVFHCAWRTETAFDVSWALFVLVIFTD